jgi:hypothetical protein
MRPDMPYFIILLCLTPVDFTRQGESAAIQWVNPLSRNAPSAPYFFFTCLTPDDFTRQWGSSAA